ncbi:hypothetical protein JAAARDRAFT_67601 [Jaapia argillacea MUCL 33604]|uniref:PWWP domain-containing protein n=1 Tax=Jaapia argillacea MUCL 33604 TaxID=933084 RepID=A0A067QF50_9AGAM|nr:hypothetical protein JAAARDRAFT_67601 [Jaapia argillacea MUCL 33604]
MASLGPEPLAPRGAARRAAASFKAQLESSPVRGDESPDSGNSSGDEVSSPTRKPLVKKQYGKLRGRMGRAVGSGKGPVASSSKQGGRPRVSSSAPASGTARSTGKSISATRPQSKPKGKGKAKPTSRKRPLSDSAESNVSSEEEEQHDGIPVASDSSEFPEFLSTHSPPKSKAKPLPKATPSRPKPTNTFMSSPLTPDTRPTSRRRTLTASALLPLTPSKSSPQVRAPFREDKWERPKLKALVWVRVDRGGRAIESTLDDEDLEAYWWPGQVSHANSVGNLMISLFGQPSPSASRIVDLTPPSQLNVLSMQNPRKSIRFNASTFRLSQPLDPSQGSPKKDLEASPKKKQKTDIEARWTQAFDDMLKADAEANDGLPEFISHGVAAFSSESELSDLDSDDDDSSKSKSKRTPHRVKTQTRPRAKSTGRKHKPQDEMEGEAGENWSPPLPDPSLQIPGELLLAKGKKTATEYWPAKILRYVPPKGPNDRNKEGLYELVYLSLEIKKVPRSFFYTSDEPEFGTCKMGQFESAVSLKDADDEGDDDSPPPSPTSSAPNQPFAFPIPAVPITIRAFYDLSIPHQLAYTMPALTALIKGEYPPATRNHLDYLKGGSLQKKVKEASNLRGDLKAKEVAECLKVLQKWVFWEVTGGLPMLGWPVEEQVDGGQVHLVSPPRRDVMDLTISREASVNPTVVASSPPREPPSSMTVPDDDAMEEDEVVPDSQPIVLDDVGGFEPVQPSVPQLTTDASVPSQPDASALEPNDNDDQMNMVAMEQEELANGSRTSPVDVDRPHFAHDSPQRTAEASPVNGPPSSMTVVADDPVDNPPFDGSGYESDITRSSESTADEDARAQAAERRVEELRKTLVPQRLDQLGHVQLIEYCSCVILPEAIVQLMLWRNGARNSLELQNWEDERRLHGFGLEEAGRSDWVHDILRLREVRNRLESSKILARTKPAAPVGGTRSRPKYN